MKDYNSIPFKNKAIDRLTRNTTIIPDSMIVRPDTKFKEVTVKPSPEQVGAYTKKTDAEINYIMGDTGAMQHIMGDEKMTMMDENRSNLLPAYASRASINRKDNTSISAAKAEREAARKANAYMEEQFIAAKKKRNK
jgi:hypothetical protein